MNILSLTSTLLSFGNLLKGQKSDYPALKDTQGNWLPYHYMQHLRATEDASQEWIDGHTICDDATGIPLARWSYAGQEIQPVRGFTIQGLPVYEELSPAHPIWSTVRGGPAHLVSPGSEGQTMRKKSGTLLSGLSFGPYRRGEALASYLGMYGPLEQGLTVEEDSQAPGKPKGLRASTALLLGSGALALAGASPVASLGLLGGAMVMGRLEQAQGPGHGLGSRSESPNPDHIEGGARP